MGFLVLLALLNIFQHQFLSMYFLSGRHAVFYLPLFFILVFILWQKSNNIILTHFVSFLLLIILIHNFSTLNTQYYLTWKQDASTKDAVKIIEDFKKNDDQKTTIGISWFFEPSVNYYIIKNNLTWIEPVDRSGPDGFFNYYYVLEEDLDLLEKYNLTPIKKFKLSNTYLLTQKK